MHRFMRAIGFSRLMHRSEEKKIITDVIINASKRSYTTNTNETIIAEFCKDFAPGLGIAVCGEFDEKEQYSYDYFYPYLRSQVISSVEDITVERHAEKESYAGVCDDIRVGITIIFYLQNIIPYIKRRNDNLLPFRGTTLSLSGLSIQGTIIMPIEKDEYERDLVRNLSAARAKWMDAARLGDEEAIEHLTLEDMDTYTSISKMMKNDKVDVLSIVDTYFMPYGVECDHYAIMGEIMELQMVVNSLTREKIWKMVLLCNELCIEVCINEKDLYGEPQIGRRFRGVIWLQGTINFP